MFSALQVTFLPLSPGLGLKDRRDTVTSISPTFITCNNRQKIITFLENGGKKAWSNQRQHDIAKLKTTSWQQRLHILANLGKAPPSANTHTFLQQKINVVLGNRHMNSFVANTYMPPPSENVDVNCGLHFCYHCSILVCLTVHQWLFQISRKLPSAKIELGPIYDRLVNKFSFSGLKMRLPGL